MSWKIHVLSADASRNLIFFMMCSALPTCSCRFELVITISIPDLCNSEWCPLSRSPCSADFLKVSWDMSYNCLSGLWKVASSSIIIVICPLSDCRISSARMKWSVSSLGN